MPDFPYKTPFLLLTGMAIGAGLTYLFTNPHYQTVSNGTEVYLKVSNIIVSQGSVITLTATVVNNGAPASYVPVEFYANGKFSGTSITDSSGEASMQFIPNSVGYYELYAESLGTQSNKVEVIVHEGI